ncbi:MAG TPA: hypothetical protein PLU52_03425 [Opitutaceae bacterium]|nr:hypothetical protein [Opitutaceae bacterium]HND61024.1 hypothetical protein [Opitutaceae bacterium]
MKSPLGRILAATILWLALAVSSRAQIWYVFSHGQGYQQQTAMTEYDESWDFDYPRGFTPPIVDWSSTTFSYGYLLTVVVDTDYASGYYYNCAYQTGGPAINVLIG